MFDLNAMYIMPRPEGARPVKIDFLPVGAYVVLVTAPVLLTGFFFYFPDRLSFTAHEVAAKLLSSLYQ